jgi:alpha-maltose-1-phosphate synthase
VTTAILFHPEGYSTQGPRLMGRHAAGESFLKAFLRHGTPGPLWIQVERPEHATPFVEAARAQGRNEPVHLIDPPNLKRLAQAGALYMPGPDLAAAAWRRQFFDARAWSLCGITHTTASAGAMDQITNLLAAPVHPWDALICTSRAVRANVEKILLAQQEYLRERLGASRFTRPLLPVIPLGIHTDDFAFTPPQRAEARRELGLSASDIAVLFVGRLSFHAKAHPLVMYQALARAARAYPDRRVVLVECGWFSNDALRNAFDSAAGLACPAVDRIVLDGRIAAERTRAWAGADIFCSLSDNIQESFGIVPIEAMACGLPVVVSDWDGYRDTVRDGIDGFRVPTAMPPPGAGEDLAMRHATGADSYDRYCGHTASFIAVDVTAATEALTRLIGSPDLRAQLGEAGRARARDQFDWRHIMSRYEALWAEQARMRTGAERESHGATARWPARMDPFTSFSAYPTAPLLTGTRVNLTGSAADVARWRTLHMVNYADPVLPTPAQVEAWIHALEAGPRTLGSWLARVDDGERAHLTRGLLWLAKLGVVGLTNPTRPEKQGQQPP